MLVAFAQLADEMEAAKTEAAGELAAVGVDERTTRRLLDS